MAQTILGKPGDPTQIDNAGHQLVWDDRTWFVWDPNGVYGVSMAPRPQSSNNMTPVIIGGAALLLLVLFIRN